MKDNLKVLSHSCRTLGSYVLKLILVGASAELCVGKLGMAAGLKSSCLERSLSKIQQSALIS